MAFRWKKDINEIHFKIFTEIIVQKTLGNIFSLFFMHLKNHDKNTLTKNSDLQNS